MKLIIHLQVRILKVHGTSPELCTAAIMSLHHELAACERVVLRLVHRADVVLEVLRALLKVCDAAACRVDLGTGCRNRTCFVSLRR